MRAFRTEFLGGALVALGLLLLPSPVGAQQPYELVILNGRVIDPESGLDAVLSIGIRGGRIETITAGALSGRDTIDAGQLVVAPGFIGEDGRFDVATAMLRFTFPYLFFVSLTDFAGGI